MNTSWIIILVMCIVIVGSLSIWLTAVHLAARKPHFEHPHGEPMRGRVQGGMHVGGGRSVAPRRDEPVPPEDAPVGDTVSPDQRDRQ
jgi:hypothetical protein